VRRLLARYLKHDPEKWVPVFGKRSCSSKKLKRDDDSKKSRRALADTSSSATVEFGLLAAGAALAIVLGLMQLGVAGRGAARALLIGNQKPEIGNQ
jgi:Flp pilus assembly pilin Flp